MVVIVVVMIVISHGRRIGAIFRACRDAAAVKGKSMPTISRGRTPLTLINVFTVPPEKQDELIALLTDVTRHNVRHHKGFISASLHRGIDGNKVTMYAQWASIEDYQSMRQNSGPAPALEQALKLATFDPGMYEVAEVFLPDKA